MKIMLIHPPSAYHRETFPLGIAYLGAVLEKRGCEVKVIDASALRCFMDVNDIVGEVKAFSPDVVGITLIINLIEKGYSLAREISKLGIPVIAGGSHAKLCTEEVLNNHFDIVVRGEAELTILDLVDYFETKEGIENILGISYKGRNGEIINNPDRPFIENLDTIPYPARHLFPLSNYTPPGRRDNDAYWTVLTSRGCPKQCIYCVSVHGTFGGRYRFRSAENVYEELIYLKRKYNIRQIKFYDDTFTINRERVSKICDLISSDKQLDIKWVCESRIDYVTEEMLNKMKAAGCFHVFYGIESYDRETLKMIKKGITPEMIDKVIGLTRKAGIDFTTYLILGWPWENASHINKTVDFIRNMPTDVKCSHSYYVPTPYPRTELYEANHIKYNFTHWWLKENAFERFYENKDHIPYFRLIMPYIDHFYLRKNFFKRDKKFQKYLAKVFLLMGKIEMMRLHGRVKGSLIFFSSRFSLFLNKINPEIERVVFKLLRANFIRTNIKKLLNIK